MSPAPQMRGAQHQTEPNTWIMFFFGGTVPLIAGSGLIVAGALAMGTPPNTAGDVILLTVGILLAKAGFISMVVGLQIKRRNTLRKTRTAPVAYSAPPPSYEQTLAVDTVYSLPPPPYYQLQRSSSGEITTAAPAAQLDSRSWTNQPVSAMRQPAVPIHQQQQVAGREQPAQNSNGPVVVYQIRTEV